MDTPTQERSPRSELPQYQEFVQTHRTKLWQASEKGYSPLEIAGLFKKAGMNVRPKLLKQAMENVLGAK